MLKIFKNIVSECTSYNMCMIIQVCRSIFYSTILHFIQEMQTYTLCRTILHKYTKEYGFGLELDF